MVGKSSRSREVSFSQSRTREGISVLGVITRSLYARTKNRYVSEQTKNRTSWRNNGRPKRASREQRATQTSGTTLGINDGGGAM